MLASGLMKLQPQGQTWLLLPLEKTTCFCALVLTSLKICKESVLPSYYNWKQNDTLIVMLLKTFHSMITFSLSWQLGAIGLQTSLGQARPYLGNTDVLILHIWWESLTMHGGHFIPAASLPANSALLWQSLCILLSSLCLPYLCFSGCQLSQRKGLEHVNCSFPEAILPKTYWQWSKFSLLPITKAETVLSYLCIFPFWFLEQFHGNTNSISWHFQMKQMQHLNTDSLSQKCHPIEDEIPQA